MVRYNRGSKCGHLVLTPLRNAFYKLQLRSLSLCHKSAASRTYAQNHIDRIASNVLSTLARVIAWVPELK